MTKVFGKDTKHNCNKSLIKQKAELKTTLPNNISTKPCSVSLCVQWLHKNIRHVIC